MKKLMNLLLSLTLVLALAGCGKAQSATYVMEVSQDGLNMTDTMIYQATGDIVTLMEEHVKIDLSGLDDATKELMIASYDSIYGEMGADVPEGVTFEYNCAGDTYTVDIVMDLKVADLQELSERGLLMLSSENGEQVKVISFKQTCEFCEANGYVLQQ